MRTNQTQEQKTLPTRVKMSIPFNILRMKDTELHYPQRFANMIQKDHDQDVEEDDCEKLLPNQTFYLLVHPFEGKVVNLKY